MSCAAFDGDAFDRYAFSTDWIGTWSFDRQLLQLMPFRVIVQTLQSRSTDGYSVRTYTTASSGYKYVQARIEHANEVVVEKGGKNSVSDTRVITPPFDVDDEEIDIKEEDKITFPDCQFDPASPRILRVKRLADQHGNYGFVVLV